MIERPDAVNWSTLREMCTSPKHYRHRLDNPLADTEALLLGRLTHALVYEPETVPTRYVRAPNWHRGMKDDTARAKGYDGGKDAAAAWDAANAGRDIITPELWDRASGIAAALHDDPIAGPMIVGGFSEQLITWTDAETGIECRGRVDHVNGCLSDLKTSVTVDQRQFAAKAVRLGDHAQLAFYADGLEANGIGLDGDPCLIVAESTKPHDVLVLAFEPEDIAAGRAVYRECLDMLAWCRENDSWPGVAGDRRQRIALPSWAAPLPEDVPLTMGGEPIDF